MVNDKCNKKVGEQELIYCDPNEKADSSNAIKNILKRRDDKKTETEW